MSTVSPTKNTFTVVSNVPEAITKISRLNTNNVENTSAVVGTPYNMSATTMNYRFNVYYNPEYTPISYTFTSISGKQPSGTITPLNNGTLYWVQYPNTQWTQNDGWVLDIQFDTGEEEVEPEPEPVEPEPTEPTEPTEPEVTYNDTLVVSCNLPLSVQKINLVDSRGNIRTINIGDVVSLTKELDYTIQAIFYPEYNIDSALFYSLRGLTLNTPVIDNVEHDVVVGGVLSSLGDDWTLDIKVSEKIVTPNPSYNTTFNRLYSVTLEKLKSISNDRFTQVDGSDLDDYIINVLELPLTFPFGIVGDEIAITLGTKVLETTAPKVVSDIVTIPLGSIQVPDKYNNSLSYNDVEVKLYTPFNNPINIDAHYAIGYTLSVDYIIDLYFGNVVINVSSSKTGRVIFTDTIKIGRNIPFLKRLTNEGTANNMTNTLGIMNKLYKPYVEVIQPMLNDEPKEVVRTGSLIDETGLVYAENFMFETDALPSEKDTILNLLKNGVIIR